jgi:hypothetical protein
MRDPRFAEMAELRGDQAGQIGGRDRALDGKGHLLDADLERHDQQRGGEQRQAEADQPAFEPGPGALPVEQHHREQAGKQEEAGHAETVQEIGKPGE